MTLHISHQHEYDGPCPRPAEVTTHGDLARGERRWICGCGFCPKQHPEAVPPDRKVDDAEWRNITEQIEGDGA